LEFLIHCNAQSQQNAIILEEKKSLESESNLGNANPNDSMNNPV